MFKEEQFKNSSINDRSKELSKTQPRLSYIANFVEQLHSVNGLHVISAVSQIILGITVVTLSLVNLIQPLWVATIITVIGSINTMIGIFFLYKIFKKSGGFDSLLQKAIKRVVNSQN